MFENQMSGLEDVEGEGFLDPVPGVPPVVPQKSPEPQGEAPKCPDDSADDTLKVLTELGQAHTGINGESHIHTITIIGQIEGHMVLPPQNKTTKYEHILPQLVGVEQNPSIEGMLVILNTVGGDVEAGLAIAEMIESMSKATVSLVLGGGHSIGVPIAVASDHSFIAETATMTIHPLRLSGMLVGVPQTYEYLDKMQDRIIKFVTKHSTISEERFRSLMFKTGDLARDIGTVLIGKEAVEVGLIGSVGGLGQALRRLDGLIAEKRR